MRPATRTRPDTGGGGIIAEPIYRSENLAIRFTPAADTTRMAITFDSLAGPHDLTSPAFGERFFAARGVPVIGVSCRGADWYQYPDMLAALAVIRARAKGAARVMTYGSSMGAYAAIRFAGRVGATLCLALSPQYSNDRRRVPFERRWGQEARAIRWRDELEGPIRADCRPVVVYDPRDADARHVDLIARDIAIERVPLPYGGHPIATYLHSAHVLRDLPMALLEDRFDAAAFVSAMRAGRLGHPVYLGELSRRHPPHRARLGLALAREAMRLSPDSDVTHHWLAARLTALGEHAEALPLHAAAVRIANGFPGYKLPYSEALAAAGEPARALAIARELAAEHGGMAQVRAWHARLLRESGAMDAAIAEIAAARRLAPANWRYKRTEAQYRWERVRRWVWR